MRVFTNLVLAVCLTISNILILIRAHLSSDILFVDARNILCFISPTITEFSYLTFKSYLTEGLRVAQF